MNKELIANLLVNSSKKAMLDVIENTDDIEFLKTEFTKTLNEKWDLQQERDKYKSIVEELKKYLEEESKKDDTYFIPYLASIHKTLDKIKELEEGNSNE